MKKQILTWLGRAIRWGGYRCRLFAFTCRRLWCVLACPYVLVDPGARLSRSVKLRATDGGEIIIKSNCVISEGVCIVAKGGRIELGENAFIGPWSTIVSISGISIGSNCLVAERVTVRDQNHFLQGDPEVPINQSGFESAPIFIGENVWVCAGAVVLKGVTIGRGAVVAANAVVTQAVEDMEIVGGVPAVGIGKRNMSDSHITVSMETAVSHRVRN